VGQTQKSFVLLLSGLRHLNFIRLLLAMGIRLAAGWRLRRNGKMPLTLVPTMNTFRAVIQKMNIRLLGNALLLGGAAVGF